MKNSLRESNEESTPLTSWNHRSVGLVLVVLILGVSLSPLAGFLVLWWVRYSKLPYSEIGLARPKSWTFTIAGGIFTGIILKILIKNLIVQFFGFHPINENFQFIYGNTGKWLLYSLLAIFFAGFGEEIVWRGFLFQRLKTLFGEELVGEFLILIITTLVFGLPHYLNQGFEGAVNGVIAGLLFGLLYLFSGKNLWYVMLTHAVWDIFSFTIIYLGIEEKLSKLL